MQNIGFNIVPFNIREAGLFINKIYGDDNSANENTIELLVASGLGCNLTDLNYVLTIEEIYGLERKFDDVLPDSGRIRSEEASCMTGSSYNEATNSAEKSCFLRYISDLEEML